MKNTDQNTYELAEGEMAGITRGSLSVEFTESGLIVKRGDQITYRDFQHPAPQAEAAPAAAPNIITDSKTATALKQLHDVGDGNLWTYGAIADEIQCTTAGSLFVACAAGFKSCHW